jgi:hypothetical protein
MVARKFAEGTEVPVARTRAELEDMLGKYGATATAIFNSTNNAAVAFEMHGRRIMMKLALPDPQAREFTHAKINQHSGDAPLSAEAARARHEKACRRKWRSLLLAVKAKLVSVEEGVETFEDAFMAHVVMPDGATVADHVRPRIAQAYRDQKMVPLLPYLQP